MGGQAGGRAPADCLPLPISLPTGGLIFHLTSSQHGGCLPWTFSTPNQPQFSPSACHQRRFAGISVKQPASAPLLSFHPSVCPLLSQTFQSPVASRSKPSPLSNPVAPPYLPQRRPFSLTTLLTICKLPAPLHHPPGHLSTQTSALRPRSLFFQDFTLRADKTSLGGSHTTRTTLHSGSSTPHCLVTQPHHGVIDYFKLPDAGPVRSSLSLTSDSVMASPLCHRENGSHQR